MIKRKLNCKEEGAVMLKTNCYTMVAGVGKGSTELNAFDNALYHAGVGNYNLIKVSSILPPESKEETKVDVVPGAILPIAYGSIGTKESGKRIVAAVGVGIPKDVEKIGVIMEYSGFGEEKQAEIIVQKMVQEAMTNRKIEIMEIKCASCSCYTDSDFCCVFAGIALW